jgi:hypothetical protein
MQLPIRNNMAELLKRMHPERAHGWAHHFAVFGFTSAYGRPVKFAIIIAVSTLITDVVGFNPLSKGMDNVSDEDIQGLEK